MTWWELGLLAIGIVAVAWLLVAWYLRWAYRGLNDHTD